MPGRVRVRVRVRVRMRVRVRVAGSGSGPSLPGGVLNAITSSATRLRSSASEKAWRGVGEMYRGDIIGRYRGDISGVEVVPLP